MARPPKKIFGPLEHLGPLITKNRSSVMMRFRLQMLTPVSARFVDHFRQCLHDLFFSVVDVAQRVHKQVVHILDVLGEETHSGASERICGSECRRRFWRYRLLLERERAFAVPPRGINGVGAPFRGAPRGALGDDLACPAGVAIQIHRCKLGPLDHAFGFYNKLKGNIYDSRIQYELFVDMGESESEARSVKRTRVDEAFRSVGTKMRFLFDYGDNWEFLVELIKRKPKEPKVKLPRLLLSAGKAPTQYPDHDDE